MICLLPELLHALHRSSSLRPFQPISHGADAKRLTFVRAARANYFAMSLRQYKFDRMCTFGQKDALLSVARKSRVIGLMIVTRCSYWKSNNYPYWGYYISLCEKFQRQTVRDREASFQPNNDWPTCSHNEHALNLLMCICMVSCTVIEQIYYRCWK